MKGLILGLALAAVPGLVWSLIVQVTGTAPTMMGDQAEQWTAQELRKAGQHGWRAVNHFRLKVNDIDHVLIGPGGVFAVETKWSGDRDSSYADAQERQAVAQASSNARSMSLWAELRRNQITVQPVVVLWGGGVRTWDQGRCSRVLDGVPVLTGSTISSWIRALPKDVLSPAEVEGVWTSVEAQARRRDDHDPAELAVPMSVNELLARFGLVVVGAYAALLEIGGVLRLTGSVTAVLAVGSLSVAVAGALSRLGRLGRLRLAAWGWIAGAGLPVTALLVAETLRVMP
jgi:hypothetical protein